jgi:hypothetical protein
MKTASKSNVLIATYPGAGTQPHDAPCRRN